MATYSITFHSDIDGIDDRDDADWGSEVYLTMFGTKASSPEFEPARAGSVEPGGPTRYRVLLTDLGEIQRVRVRHDDTGVGRGRYLDRIVVQAAGTLEEWTFVCKQWLSRQGDSVTERTLDALLPQISP
jgi:hypothetical protein